MLLHVSMVCLTLMGKLAKQNVGLNRKVLADLAMNNPKAFEAIVNQVK